MDGLLRLRAPLILLRSRGQISPDGGGYKHLSASSNQILEPPSLHPFRWRPHLTQPIDPRTDGRAHMIHSLASSKLTRFPDDQSVCRAQKDTTDAEAASDGSPLRGVFGGF